MFIMHEAARVGIHLKQTMNGFGWMPCRFGKALGCPSSGGSESKTHFFLA
jgi:hypothetical protein